MTRIIETLKRICELQPHYSPNNTPQMEERGRLVRQSLHSEISAIGPELRIALGHHGDNFLVEASDGIGRKTEAPWVRFCNAEMSPNPRTGFYSVTHFAADGSAVFVTVGCGATKWANGELRPYSDADLRQKTDWARQVIIESFGGMAPFSDQISLGARADLPRAFEKATALAKRIPASELDETGIQQLLIEAAKRLRSIYDAQRIGRDLTMGELAEVEMSQLRRPIAPGSRSRVEGQVFCLSPEERNAVALRAMKVAGTWLTSNGYAIRDVSGNSPFDFEATRNGELLKVEVKGSTSSVVDAIFMTRNEVDLHRAEKGATALVIVSKIVLTNGTSGVTAAGGDALPLVGWDIDEWTAIPLAYRLTRSPH